MALITELLFTAAKLLILSNVCKIGKNWKVLALHLDLRSRLPFFKNGQQARRTSSMLPRAGRLLMGLTDPQDGAQRADLLYQSVAPAESFNRPGDRLVAANDSLVGANDSLAAANDSLVGANNEKGETKQQETDAHLFENQRSEPAKRAAAWGVCTSAATIAAAGTKKQQCKTKFLTLLQSVGCLMNLRGPPESDGWSSAIKRAYLTVSVKLGAKALYSGAYWLWARTRPERKVPMRIARPSTVKVNLPFGNLR